MKQNEKKLNLKNTIHLNKPSGVEEINIDTNTLWQSSRTNYTNIEIDEIGTELTIRGFLQAQTLNYTETEIVKVADLYIP